MGLSEERCPVRPGTASPACVRQRLVDFDRVGGSNTQPGAQAQRILQPPGQAAFGARALEVPHQQDAEAPPLRTQLPIEGGSLADVAASATRGYGSAPRRPIEAWF